MKSATNPPVPFWHEEILYVAFQCGWMFSAVAGWLQLADRENVSIHPVLVEALKDIVAGREDAALRKLSMASPSFDPTVTAFPPLAGNVPVRTRLRDPGEVCGGASPCHGVPPFAR